MSIRYHFSSFLKVEYVRTGHPLNSHSQQKGARAPQYSVYVASVSLLAQLAMQLDGVYTVNTCPLERRDKEVFKP